MQCFNMQQQQQGGEFGIEIHPVKRRPFGGTWSTGKRLIHIDGPNIDILQTVMYAIWPIERKMLGIIHTTFYCESNHSRAQSMRWRIETHTTHDGADYYIGVTNHVVQHSEPDETANRRQRLIYPNHPRWPHRKYVGNWSCRNAVGSKSSTPALSYIDEDSTIYRERHIRGVTTMLFKVALVELFQRNWAG